MINYIVSTGTILKEYLEENNITQKELAEKIGSSERHISNVINGKVEVTTEFALKLEKAFPDAKAEFWLDLEKHYRLNLLRNQHKEIELKDLELKELSGEYQFDYVFRGLGYKIEKKAEEMLKILGVSSFSEANEKALQQESLFSHDGGNPQAQLVWIKLCEREFDIQNNIQNLAIYDKETLFKNLNQLKKIMNTTDYDFAVKNIRRLLNKYGIGLVTMDAVPTSKIRGATKIVDNIPAIFLSTRYKNLDSFYFTLLHEIHHLLEDDLSKDGYQTILYEDDDREFRSNEFARNTLVEEHSFKRLSNKNVIEDKDIITYANEQGVIPSVIIGLLGRTLPQERKIQFYQKFSHLRARIK